MTLTPKHVISARGLLGWNQSDLARAAGIARGTIARFELGQDPPLNQDSIERIQLALEQQGIEFMNSGSPGVRLRPERAVRTEH